MVGAASNIKVSERTGRIDASPVKFGYCKSDLSSMVRSPVQIRRGLIQSHSGWGDFVSGHS
jgi:hypothetical protein